MKRLVIFAAAGILAGLLVALFTTSQKPGHQPATTDMKWQDFQYELQPEDYDSNFDLVLTVNTPEEIKTGFRVLLHFADDQNYSALTLAPSGAEVISVQAGQALKRGEYTGKVLPEAGEPTLYRLQWRTPRLHVLKGGEHILTATLPHAAAGKAGVGLPVGEEISAEGLHVQPVVPIAFADDFMRAANDISNWTNDDNKWGVRSLDNPSRSANAFVYQCSDVPDGSFSLIGKPYWDAYEAAVSFQGGAGTSAGIVFHGQDRDNLYYLRWQSRMAAPAEKPEESEGTGENDNKEGEEGEENEAAPPPAVKNTDAVLQLVVRRNGKEEVLFSKEGGFRPGQWYRMKVIAGAGRMDAYIDGHKFFHVNSTAFYGGLSGLYAAGETAVEFDDFTVTTYRGELPPAPEVSIITGNLALYGDPDWRSYKLTSRITVSGLTTGERRSIGVVAWQSSLEYFRYEISRAGEGKLRQTLVKVADGKEEEVASNLLPEKISQDIIAGKEHTLNLTLDRGVVGASISEGAHRLNAWAGEGAHGYSGVYLQEHGTEEESRILNAAITPIEPPLPVASINEVFDEERMMRVWSGTAGDWRPGATDGSPYDQIFWHRALFYGDSEIEATIPEMQQRNDEKPFSEKEDNDKGGEKKPTREVALSISKPVITDTAHNGYTLRYLTDEKNNSSLMLIRAGKKVDTISLPAAVLPRRLRLRQEGSVVVGFVDDRPLVTYNDPEPLQGKKVAWAARGMDIARKNVSVYNRNLKSYSFNRAAVDWRVGAGVWEVTNRWECDPRWSFWAGMTGTLASGRIANFGKYLSEDAEWKVASLQRQLDLLPDPEDPHVVLWHKEGLAGDFMVEFYIAQMMDYSRGGGSYQKYVSNFNITVGADGSDLSSGYSCILGGWNNTRSAIYRRNQAVAESSSGLQLRGSHRRWVRIRVERSGDLLLFHAFMEKKPGEEEVILALEYKDPHPLPGRRIAVWSHDNGILMTRARLSADNFTMPEDPFATWPAEVESVYGAENNDEEDGEQSRIKN